MRMVRIMARRVRSRRWLLSKCNGWGKEGYGCRGYRCASHLHASLVLFSDFFYALRVQLGHRIRVGSGAVQHLIVLGFLFLSLSLFFPHDGSRPRHHLFLCTVIFRSSVVLYLYLPDILHFHSPIPHLPSYLDLTKRYSPTVSSSFRPFCTHQSQGFISKM